MTKFKIFIWVFSLLMGYSQVYAQNDISPARKMAIDSLALEKVRDLSKFYRHIFP